MKAKTDEQPGASELEGLGEAVGGVLSVGAKAVGEVASRVGSAVSMLSAEPMPQQNIALAEPGAADRAVSQKEFARLGGARPETTRAAFRERGEQNIAAINANRNWRETRIEGWGSPEIPDVGEISKSKLK